VTVFHFFLRGLPLNAINFILDLLYSIHGAAEAIDGTPPVNGIHVGDELIAPSP
jgi:hypothetical protein